MKKLSEIFNIWYGVNLEFINCEQVKDGMPFVSRQATGNGIVGYVTPIDIVPNPPHTLSIAGSGNVLSTFYHDYEYYSGRDVYIAEPKQTLTREQMLFYAYLIEANKYRYNYGRQANKTLGDIVVPDVDELPDYVSKVSLNDYEFDARPLCNEKTSLNTEKWGWFRYDEIFDVRKGFYNKKPDDDGGGTVPFIGAYDSNNGITSWYTGEAIERASKTGDGPNVPIGKKIFKPNCVTVSNNGSVGYAFYQPGEFTCSHDVNPLYLKNRELNRYIAVFLCTLIELERYRWAYGRKWRPVRMPNSLIKLPITKDGAPNWRFMEDYVKSLPYSRLI